MSSSCSWGRVVSVLVLAFGLAGILPSKSAAQQGFVRIAAEANCQIIGIDASGLVTWRHATGSGNYTVWFSRELKADDWVAIDNGSVSGEIQTCMIPITGEGQFSIAGRLFFSTQPLANHPVEIRDEELNLLDSAQTDGNGAFSFGHLINGQYYVGTPDIDDYLNIYALVVVENMGVVDIEIYVPRQLTVTQPPDFATLSERSPTIQWNDPFNSASYSIAIYALPGHESIENDVLDIPVYQVQQPLADGDYQARIAAYNAAGNEIGRGAVNFTVTENGGGETTANVRGYLHNNNVRIPNHPIWLLNQDRSLFAEQHSDANGDFIFSDVPFGTYQLFSPEQGDYNQNNEPLTVDEWSEGSIRQFHLMKIVEFISPEAGATVAGENVLIHWNAVTGANRYSVDIYQGQTFFDFVPLSGTSITRDLSEGSYRIEVLAIAANGLQIGSGEIEFTVGGGGGGGDDDNNGIMTIFGYLYNHDGERIPDHPVRLYDQNWVLIGEQQSDADGKFIFPDIPEQEYDLYCPSHGDYFTAQMRVWDADHAQSELGMPLLWLVRITNPIHGSTVATTEVEIQWQPLDGTEMYGIEIINYDNYAINNYWTTESSYTASNLGNGWYWITVTALINWTVELDGSSWGNNFGRNMLNFWVSVTEP